MVLKTLLPAYLLEDIIVQHIDNLKLLFYLLYNSCCAVVTTFDGFIYYPRKINIWKPEKHL